ncbi:hypothetical protein EKN44_01910 [Enterobacter hormaechei]|nr:hypothetical protein EKN44_01910 [Enterobacter hormaechei]
MWTLQARSALTCYGLVSSEVSHRIATMVNRHVVHTDNTDLHIPATCSGEVASRTPPDRYDTCSICRTAHTWKRTHQF